MTTKNIYNEFKEFVNEFPAILNYGVSGMAEGVFVTGGESGCISSATVKALMEWVTKHGHTMIFGVNKNRPEICIY